MKSYSLSLSPLARFAANALPVGLAIAAVSGCAAHAGTTAKLEVDAKAAGKAISPNLYGIFFEEINRAGDGGIYAEMVENRSFEDATNLFHDPQAKADLGAAALKDTDDAIGWAFIQDGAAKGSWGLDRERPLNASNPTSLRLTMQDGAGRVGIANDGFRGIPIGTPERTDPRKLATWRKRFEETKQNGGLNVEQGKVYDLSVYLRALAGAGALTATLEAPDGTVLARADLGKPGNEFGQVKVALRPSKSENRARLVLATTQPGTYWLDMVSLFPQDTWHGRANGLRPDLMEKIAAMKPAFVRFPGGCFVEGYYYGEYPRWKESVGDIATRKEGYAYWGYGLTNGLGYHEYLQMCEDLGAQPLFVINCGMHHAGRAGGTVAEPMEKMGPFVQDALDAIEYANGPVTSEWGALRAKNGHPAPFNLHLMEIGNENGGADYNQRFALFQQAIKAKYPKVELVACDWNGAPRSSPWDYLDSHHYGNTASFWNQVTRYDNADRNGFKTYFGEYAVTDNVGKGNLDAAVAEAAFLTGLERNGDVVRMSSYAPLLVRKGWDRWNPNAIAYDQSRVYGTPSYWLQTIFAPNRPDVVLPAQLQLNQETQPLQGKIGVGTWSTQAEFKDIKVTKGDTVLLDADFNKGTVGWNKPRGQWSVADGALRQTGKDNGALAEFGDPNWTDYTLTLKARKLGGAEGFLIAFSSTGGENTTWWNLGGWGNTLGAVQGPGIDEQRFASVIETGRWYDIRIELQGPTAKCFLDGKLLQTVTRHDAAALAATAGRDLHTGETIVKLVNGSDRPVETTVNLNGASGPVSGQSWLLTGPDRHGENSFEHPTAVAPQLNKLAFKSPQFRQTLPPLSVTVLRLKTAK